MTLRVGTEAAGQRTGPGVPSENYWFRRHVAAYRFARRLVRGTVVDAGSGEGYGGALLSRSARVIGMDLDAEVVTHAARTYRDISIMRADVCRLPLAEASVDGIVTLQVLEHLHCPEAFVESARRALRGGGVLAVSTPNSRTFPAGNPWHVHEYDAGELGGLLASSFPAVRVRGIGHGPGLRALDWVLGHPVQHRLVGRPYEDQPAWLRAVLRTVTSRDFRLTDRTDESLDLIAVAAIP
jgi:SAM-dependent methyltransferase